MKSDINSDILRRNAIKKWRQRVIDAGKHCKDLAKEAKVPAGHLSQLMRLKIKNPHKSTTNKIEKVLESWGV